MKTTKTKVGKIALPTLDKHNHINDPKLSDRGVRRGTCTVGGKAAAEAGAVTHGAVRCSAWLANEQGALLPVEE